MSRQAGPLVGVYHGIWNGSLKKVGLGKFWPDLKISELFVTGFEVSFFRGSNSVNLHLEFRSLAKSLYPYLLTFQLEQRQRQADPSC